jgi:hypothetical protein
VNILLLMSLLKKSFFTPTNEFVGATMSLIISTRNCLNQFFYTFSAESLLSENGGTGIHACAFTRFVIGRDKSRPSIRK